MLIKSTIPIILLDNLLTFRDSGKEFELRGNLSKMITKKNYNVDLDTLADKKLMYDFAKEMNFDVRGQGRKSTRDRTLINLLKSTAIMASGIPTKFLSSDPDELCNRLKVILQEKQAGNNTDLINEEIVVILDKLLEYRCITEKQHEQISIKCNPLHSKKK